MDLAYQVLEIQCPCCDYNIEALLRQVTSEETLICRGCYQEIQLLDEGGSTRRAQGDAAAALSELERQLKRLGR